MENEEIKKGKYYDPKFRQDIVDEERKRCIVNIHQYYAPHLLSYYYSKKLRIKRYTKETYDEIEKMLNDPKSTLYKKGRIKPELYNIYWDLIESSGEALDEFGMVKEKIDFEERLAEIEEKYSHYDWNVLFKLQTFLFSGGKNNVVVGGMGTGKTNLILELALQTMQSGNFELITNMGIDPEYESPDIHRVAWLSDLLRIVCQNKINNMELIRKGEGHRQKTMICIIDEAENLFQSIRSGSKEIADFNLINNMSRKLQNSYTFIFHRYRDIPAQIRESPNLNAIIMKGCDMHGNPVQMSKDRALIVFPAMQTQIKIEGIPLCDLLDTNEYSSFAISEEDFPDKSVNVKYILRLASEYNSKEAPRIILNYLENKRIENIKREDLIKEIKEIEEINNDSIIICDSKTDYRILIEEAFSVKFGLDDLSQMKRVKPIIKEVVNTSWSLRKINNNLDEIKRKNVNYMICDFDELYEFLKRNKLPLIKSLVRNNYREFEKNEYDELVKLNIERTKLKSLYGELEYIMSDKEELLEVKETLYKR